MKAFEETEFFADLCAKMVHGIYCHINDPVRLIDGKPCPEYDVMVDPNNFSNVVCRHGVTVKPYLRPISSMTDEEMDKLFEILKVDKDGKDDDWIKINDVVGIKFFFPTGRWIEDVAKAYDYLNSIHIDYRGLITMGIAVKT